MLEETGQFMKGTRRLIIMTAGSIRKEKDKHLRYWRVLGREFEIFPLVCFLSISFRCKIISIVVLRELPWNFFQIGTSPK